MNGGIFTLPFLAALRQRHIVILMLSAIGHAVLLAQPWPSLSGLDDYAPRALSVSIARKPVTTNTSIQASRSSQSVAQYRADAEPPFVPEQTDAVQTTVPVGLDSEPLQPTASALPDREPDYRASYLENPQPEYPLVARRMGWQGRVVLNVEVLADGSPGEVVVQQSSGRGVLDNSALHAVRSWRFVPARRGGQAVTQNFLVPVAFSLK